MSYLLDTQVFLWFFETPERLSPEAIEALTDSDTTLYLSPASAWEIAIKWQLGKLTLPYPPQRYVPSRVALLLAKTLPITIEHTLAVAELAPHHRDPFDRLLVAQAVHDGMVLITADRIFERYPVAMLWAGA